MKPHTTIRMFVVCFLAFSTTMQAATQNLPVQELVLPVETALERNLVITDIAFSADGEWAVIVGTWSEGFLWNLKTHELRAIPVQEEASFINADIFKDSSRIATADTLGMIEIWDLESLERLTSFIQRDYEAGFAVKDIKFLDGQRVMTSYSSKSGGGLYIWDAKTGELLRHIPDDAISYRSILSNDGRFIFEPGSVVYDIEKAERVAYAIGGYTINPDFTEIYGLTHIDLDRFYYTVWDARTGEVLRQGPEEMRLTYPTEPGVDLNHEHIAWSRDGRFMFVGGVTRNGGSAVMNARTGGVARMYDIGLSVDRREFEVQQVRFLPDGKRVAVAGGRYVQIYDLSDLITDIQDSEMHED